MSKEIYKVIHQPTNFLPNDGNHYIPPKTRDSAEIDRLHGLPHGTLMIEQEIKGLEIAEQLLAQIDDPEALAFAAQIIAAGGFNSSLYDLSRGTPYMYRPLRLPQLIDEDGEHTETPETLKEKVRAGLMEAIQQANRLHGAHVEGVATRKYKEKLGRTIGNTSMLAAAIAWTMPSRSMDPHAASAEIRAQALDTVNLARDLQERIGTYPSLGQLGHRDSELAVFWRRSAPNPAYEALDAVTAA